MKKRELKKIVGDLRYNFSELQRHIEWAKIEHLYDKCSDVFRLIEELEEHITNPLLYPKYCAKRETPSTAEPSIKPSGKMTLKDVAIIEAENISKRLYNCMTKGGYSDDLIQSVSVKEFRKIRNIGTKTLQEFKRLKEIYL